MTINAVPYTSALLQKSNIPFGCVIHPMAKPTTQEDTIPVVNFGASGIVRCRRCRSYINPFVAFTDGGRRWRCNLCGLPNDVPGDYFSPLDTSGRRTDLQERPELTRGVVEFVAPSEYMVRPPQPPSYFFIIDVSYYSITSGMFAAAIETVKSALDDFPGNPRTRIGFMTFDSSVHFYNLKASLSQPQMLVVTDIEDIFLPLPDDLLVNLSDSREVVETLLTKLPSIFQSTNNVESVLGVALKAAYNVVKNIGGKLVVFASALPSMGEGKLRNREDLKLLNTDKEVSMMLPEENYYKTFALDCSRFQISVDTFLFANQFIDVATIGCLPQYTGGQMYYYPAFAREKDGEKLRRDLLANITRETGFESVMRVRASKALKTTAHFGNFFIRSTDLLALPNVDSDKAFAIQLALAESAVNGQYCSIQAALLYTTSSGERRIRVFTQCLPVITTLADVFRMCDVETITALTTKMAIEKALQTTRLLDAREALINKCIDILTVYRSEITPTSSPTQLMLPESLKLFPLYVLAMLKNVLFRSGTDVRPDERTYWTMVVRTLPISLLIPFLYPRMFPLHNLPEGAGYAGEDDVVVLPPTVNLASDKLDRTGAYLLEDGQTMFLWIGKAVSPLFLRDAFGVASLDVLDTLKMTTYMPLESELSVRIFNIINAIRAQRPTYQNIYFIKEGEPRETKFFNYLVDDKTKTIPSYFEFLTSLHSKIMSKVQKR